MQEKLPRAAGLRSTRIKAGDNVANFGYFDNKNPITYSDRDDGGGFLVKGHDLRYFRADGEGTIHKVGRWPIDYDDVKIKGKITIVSIYQGRKGMSGGPLINLSTGRVIGMMSFGFPKEVEIKETLVAVRIDETFSAIFSQ